jgi:hypothetical protein
MCCSFGVLGVHRVLAFAWTEHRRPSPSEGGEAAGKGTPDIFEREFPGQTLPVHRCFLAR